MKKVCMLLLVMTWFLVGCQKTSPIDETTKETYVSSLEKSDLESPFIKWYGRHAYVNERMYFYHTATGFSIHFYGRTIEIELMLEHKKNDIYYAIAKNDEDLVYADVIIQNDTTQTFFIEFDTFDHHTLEIVKRSEPEDGITSLKSIKTNGYFKVIEQNTDALHFLIIGASGISGHGALGNPNEQRTTANSSSLHSFGYLSARAFQGSFEFVSSSGWGLLYGFNDLTGQINIAKAYDYVGIDSSRNIVDILYDHSKTPDFIIVNIGGNDFSSVINKLSGFQRSEKVLEFKEAVAAFILKLRSDAPNAHILWTMTSGSMNGNAAQEVFQLLDPIDKPFVHMIMIKQVGDDNDLAGANNHASFITHQKSAQNLIDYIHHILGD